MSDLRDILQGIYEQHGTLTPDLVARLAKPKGHPLHERIYDRPPGEAAEAWYRSRAHELIRSVRIVYREATETEAAASVRAFHAVRSNGDDDGSYVYEPVDRVISDPFSRQLVLRDMERQWKELLARYKHFEEFVKMVGEDLSETG